MTQTEQRCGYVEPFGDESRTFDEMYLPCGLPIRQREDGEWGHYDPDAPCAHVLRNGLECRIPAELSRKFPSHTGIDGEGVEDPHAHAFPAIDVGHAARSVTR